MNLEVFAICDAATDSQGKLNILGAFDTIFAKELPARHPLCTIVVRVRFSREEEGEHKIFIDLIDDLEAPLVPRYEMTFTVRVPGEEPYATTNFIINFQNLALNRYGEHKIKLDIDGKLKATLPLFVRRPRESQG